MATVERFFCVNMTKTGLRHFSARTTKNAHCAIHALSLHAGFSQIWSHMHAHTYIADDPLPCGKISRAVFIGKSLQKHGDISRAAGFDVARFRRNTVQAFVHNDSSLQSESRKFFIVLDQYDQDIMQHYVGRSIRYFSLQQLLPWGLLWI